MNTLIIYATKHGTAKKCAEILSQKLNGRIDSWNVKEGNAPDLSCYENIIIGGSIYIGTIQKELSEFCAKNLDSLKEKKIGLYICCMNTKEADKELNGAFPQELLNRAVAKKNLGGEFRFKDMSFLEKLATKMVSKALAKEDPNLAFDTKKDVSMLSEENINELAQLINNAG